MSQLLPGGETYCIRSRLLTKAVSSLALLRSLWRNIEMFFFLSKFGWFLIAPSHLVLWLVLATALGQVLRRTAAASVFGILAALLFLAVGVLPLWVGPARMLEDQYPRGRWPAHVDGILVLGGGLDTALLRSRGVPAPEGSNARLLAGAEAARRYPNARLVFSGGSSVGDPNLAESVAAAYIFRQAGVDPRQMLLENKARDTYENLLFSRERANVRPGETWLLVTSALHMPRAMMAARTTGWEVRPWASDYLTGPSDGAYHLDIAGTLDITDAVAHEWLGLLGYRFR